ncbi:hypothetical protein GJ689_24810 [Rhodoplanes serenus]|uniref:Uncharacterized protein n=1 Tax=Rhodoplanes serenus TaxID=200615 RepID=A0A9X4XS28_9BRAD|nr:hypothetical protein [Rhodoplanes serenus]MTW19416.1 hypothetical protein [Rhodoplanes serenus]
MGVRINPCFRCPLRQGCDLVADFRRRASLASAVSITFRCAKLGAEVRRGRRIVIRTPVRSHVAGSPDDPEYRIAWREVSATICSAQPDYRFSCVVDLGQIGEDGLAKGVDPDAVRYRKTQSHYRIVRFLDEPDAKFCDSGALLRDGKCDTKDRERMCKQLTEACGSEEWRAA